MAGARGGKVRQGTDVGDSNWGFGPVPAERATIEQSLYAMRAARFSSLSEVFRVAFKGTRAQLASGPEWLASDNGSKVEFSPKAWAAANPDDPVRRAIDAYVASFQAAHPETTVRNGKVRPAWPTD